VVVGGAKCGVVVPDVVVGVAVVAAEGSNDTAADTD
jgi:hypothetical protein